MSWNPSDSAITVNKTLEERIAAASSQAAIQQLLREAAIAQAVVVPDRFDENVLLPTELAFAAPKKVGKVVTLNGVKHSITADDEAGLLAAENELYKQALAQPASEPELVEQPRNERGQFTTQEADRANQINIVRRAELELQFKRGEISATDYLEQSGAVDDYLAKKGIPVADLQEAVAEKQNAKYSQSWADATETFKSRHPEWPGGSQNLATIAGIIQEQNWMEEDPVEALEAAYSHACEKNLIVKPPELIASDKISEATSFENIREALGRTGSSLWGQ